MNLLDYLKSLPFSNYGSFGRGGGYGRVPHSGWDVGGYGFTALPGTKYDYQEAAGVLWQNPSAAACFVALTKAFAQARPVLEYRDESGWVKVDRHLLIDRLNAPNPFYSGEKMFGVTLVSTMAHGAAFWRVERNAAGLPGELWFEPPVGMGPTGIAPNWDESNFIRDYTYFVDGKAYEEPLSREDVVFFRHGLHPANPRVPWSPLRLAAREIATLNSASTYTGALLRNAAVPSGMLTMEKTGATGTTPTPEQAEEIKQKIKAGFRGDNVGEPFVSSTPWKWTPFNWSPTQLKIDKIQQWPQGIVCALLATPAIVALLPTGEAPTYQNLDASMRWWWDNTIIPLEDSFADDIETQLFPAFGLNNTDWRIVWDRSQVPALKEDEQAKHATICADFKAGVIDRDEARVALGYESKPEYRGKFAVQTKAAQGGAEDEAFKAREFREGDWVRHKGQFHRYVGAVHPDRMFSVLGEYDIPGKSGNAEREKIIWQNESLDAMHEWHGDALPEGLRPLQEKGFTDSLAKAVRHLEVNTKEGYSEAGVSVSVVEHRWCSEIVEGTQGQIKIPEPSNRDGKKEPFAKLHTHSTDEGPGAADWANFLSNKHYAQMCIVTPKFTLMFYKPPGWKHSDDISREQYLETIDEVMSTYMFSGRWGNEEQLREETHPFVGLDPVTREICEEYGILYRTGIRVTEKGDRHG